jgi:hypothetical protein
VTGVSARAMLGRSQRRPVARARMLAWWLSRAASGCSYLELSRYWRRDHSTLVQACQRLERCLVVGGWARPLLWQVLAAQPSCSAQVAEVVVATGGVVGEGDSDGGIAVP